MKILTLALAALLSAPLTGRAQPVETLTYAVTWPSGLPAGEARLESRGLAAENGAGARRELSFHLSASIPGFEVLDEYRSVTTTALCSLEFDKNSRHGKRVANERTTFDLPSATATRQTLNGGGSSKFAIPACPTDALAFLYYLRREVADGRLPSARTIYFGASYQVGLELAGEQRLMLADQTIVTDRIRVSLTGEASSTTFEINLDRTPARRLVLARVNLPAGTFLLELEH
jgi:hypothetical protein